jgi:hypothetical protein
MQSYIVTPSFHFPNYILQHTKPPRNWNKNRIFDLTKVMYLLFNRLSEFSQKPLQTVKASGSRYCGQFLPLASVMDSNQKSLKRRRAVKAAVMAKKRKAQKAMDTDASAFTQNVLMPRSEQLSW